MELWIRSQEKTRLVKCNNILLYKFEDETYGIQVNNDCFVGEYKSKERALEVLDEIQNLMQPSINFIVSQHIDFDNDGEGLIGCNILKEEPKIEKISDCIVYEMPED